MTAYYNEIDPYAAQWLRNLIAAGHIAPGDVDERDIRDVRPDDLRGYTQCHFFAGVGVWSYALRHAGWSDDRPVWTGSCPCQPFSAAGAGLGFADERHLWPHFHWLISECRPAIVLGEQVASKDAGPWVDTLHADLEALGYAFGGIPFPSASVGAPHIRDRLYWLAHADGSVGAKGSSDVRGRAAGGNAQSWPGPSSIRMSCGLANAILQQRPDGQSGIGPINDASRRIEGAAEIAGLRGDLRPGPVNGFWRDADWLLCRDGKWRPVVATHVALVDGIASGLVRVRTGKDSEKTKKREINADMQSLRKGAYAKAIQQRSSGMHVNADASEVLQQAMHGEFDAQGSLQKHQSQQDEISVASEGMLRNMRQDGKAARSPHRPQSAQQRCLELEDIVSVLPPSLSLAKLHGDRRSEGELLALQRAIYKAGTVLHPSEPIQTVWASLGKEAKDRIRLDFDASRWKKLVAFPLGSQESNRTGRLRAYGNAINAIQAQIWVETVMESVQ